MNKANKDTQPTLTEDDEHCQAIAKIVVSFVDIGFGTSPTTLSLRAANENRDFRTLAEASVNDEDRG